MRTLRLSVKEPGTLLSRLMERDITPEQFVQIGHLLEDPEVYFVIHKEQLMAVQRRGIGFAPPAEAPDAKG